MGPPCVLCSVAECLMFNVPVLASGPDRRVSEYLHERERERFLNSLFPSAPRCLRVRSVAVRGVERCCALCQHALKQSVSIQSMSLISAAPSVRPVSDHACLKTLTLP